MKPAKFEISYRRGSMDWTQWIGADNIPLATLPIARAALTHHLVIWSKHEGVDPLTIAMLPHRILTLEVGEVVTILGDDHRIIELE
jgi:hypothetical protein